ncbi:MAG: NAD-dependent epimerase/dehydratase family protein [Gammaproteobacteria bacterium]
MTILVTGAAGFIGFHLCQRLLAAGHTVLGLDNLNDYYSVQLKRDRLSLLEKQPNFRFHLLDLASSEAPAVLAQEYKKITHIVHLAAQAGVRYSLENPMAYIQANIVGHLNILEFARHLDSLEHLVYASSSSVYGANTKQPFSIEDPVNQPISLYAATKRADELMSYTYQHLFQIPSTGLRFFTVYGPWGRPDMSAFLFTKAIFEGKPLQVYNHGKMRRSFTYVDDIIDGTYNAIFMKNKTHQIFNLGNPESVELMHFLKLIEEYSGKKAMIEFTDMQPGDVKETTADITESTLALNFKPKTPVEIGLKNFINWYKNYAKY